jgi:hypothetical protein
MREISSYFRFRFAAYQRLLSIKTQKDLKTGAGDEKKVIKGQSSVISKRKGSRDLGLGVLGSWKRQTPEPRT